IVTGAGPGGGPNVRVWNYGGPPGPSGNPPINNNVQIVANFMAFDVNFSGGVNVAVGDVDGDGHADVVTGAGAGGGPNVVVVSGRDLAATGTPTPIANFFAYDIHFTAGVFVAAADFTT